MNSATMIIGITFILLSLDGLISGKITTGKHHFNRQIEPMEYWAAWLVGFLPSEQIAIGSGSFKEKIDAFGTRLIADALTSSDNNQAQAARLLGLTYDQFRHYHRKYF